ncbi:TNF receptor-associated factor 1-like [Glandiceps talaboti]
MDDKAQKGLQNGLVSNDDVLQTAESRVNDLMHRSSALVDESMVMKAKADRNTERSKSLRDEFCDDRETIKALEKKINCRWPIIAVQTIKRAKIGMRLESLETASYDGTMIWPVTSFAERRQEAIDGLTSSILSPCFFTKQSGYKMCLMLHINGDDIGRDIYVSLHLVVMRGDYDPLLKWPFVPKEVTFTLLNQVKKDGNIRKICVPGDAEFKHDGGDGIRRPPKDRRVVCGFPLFYPLSWLDDKIQEFVVEDSMFLKVRVDME